MNIAEMNFEELETRRKELISELDVPEITEQRVAEIESETAAIAARKEELRTAEANRKEVAEAIADGEIEVRKIKEKGEITMEKEIIYNAASEEYRRAWLKTLAVRKTMAGEEKLFGDLTEEERGAFTHTTANSGSVVPTAVMNRIVELVRSMAPMYEDASKSSMIQGFGIPRHTGISQGDAASTNEGAANDDEQDTFDLLPITGVEIKKHVVISRKMKWQSIDAFEDWVVDHIAKRIAVAKESRIITQLNDATYGIDSDNIITGTTASPVNYTDDQVRAVLSLITEPGAIVWYANQKTIYSGLTAIKDQVGRPLFLDAVTSDDPLVKGRIYGGLVKQDENLADDVVYVGVPKAILANNFEDLFIQNSIDPKTFESIIAGYSLFDAGLENPTAFVKITFKPGE